MTIKVLDPTSEMTKEPVVSPARLLTLEGSLIGLLDISKPRGNVFLDALEELLIEAGADVNLLNDDGYGSYTPLHHGLLSN